MDSVNPTPPPRSMTAVFGVKVYRYRAALRRYWWVVLLCASIGLLYEGWTVFRKQVAYESVSELIVREQIMNLDRTVARDPTDSMFGNTLQLLRSAQVLDGARRRVALTAPHLTGTVEIVPTVQPRTSIFAVTGTGSNPEYTQLFVDAVVDEFRTFKKSQKTGVISDSASNITEQLAQVRKDLKVADDARQEYIVKKNAPFWHEQALQATAFLSGLKGQQGQLETELQNLKTLTPDRLRTLWGLHHPDLPEFRSMLERLYRLPY